MTIDFKAIVFFICDWMQIFTRLIKTRLISKIAKDLEIIALRSQLSLLQQEILNGKIKNPRATPSFRQLWVLLSNIFPNWKSALIIVKPETVLHWHKTAFKNFWKFKSKLGRPKISPATIALIKRIHKENPLLSPEKIHERLVDLAITDAPAPNTIAKYIPTIRKSPTKKQLQSWKTFLSNHSKEIWAMDFFTVPTLYFKVLYVLIIISHDRRKIEHFAVTSNPSSSWVAQQIREATPFGHQPKYLIHDRGSMFISREFKNFLANTNIKSKKTGYRCPWQNGLCERLVGILRQELTDHIIPFNEKHLHYLLREYVHRYYNPVRTHQGIDCQTPILSDKPPDSLVKDTVLISEPILGGLYHGYDKSA